MSISVKQLNEITDYNHAVTYIIWIFWNCKQKFKKKQTLMLQCATATKQFYSMTVYTASDFKFWCFKIETGLH